MPYKMVGVDENSLFPPRVENRLGTTIQGRVNTAKADSDAKVKAANERIDLETMPVINVMAKGAKGDGVTDDTAAVQSALNGGNVRVVFPGLTFRFASSALRIYKNTVIEFAAKTKLLNDRTTGEQLFTNGEAGNSTYAGGYAGDGNIKVIGNGAVIDNGPRAARNQATSAFGFAHAENVEIDNVVFLNNYASHFIEYNSIRHGRITNCVFRDMVTGGFTNREAINVDSSTQAGFPHWGSWDNTACDDILISGNRFDNCGAGIGNHADTYANWHSNISIVDNVFSVMAEHAIRSTFFKNSVIRGNTIDRTGTQAIWADKTVDTVISDNVITRARQLSETGSSGLHIGGSESRNVVVANNRVDVVNGTNFGIRVYGGLGHKLFGNKITNPSVRDVDFNVDSAIEIDGSIRLTIADDSVGVIDLPGNKQGIVTIAGHSTAANVARGIYFMRGGAGEELAPVALSSQNTTGVDLTTGVLTGTTGTDTRSTISVAAGKLYIENRRGSSVTYTVLIVGS